MPVFIEFSKCIGTYANAKFELITILKRSKGFDFRYSKKCCVATYIIVGVFFIIGSFIYPIIDNMVVSYLVLLFSGVFVNYIIVMEYSVAKIKDVELSSAANVHKDIAETTKRHCDILSIYNAYIDYIIKNFSKDVRKKNTNDFIIYWLLAIEVYLDERIKELDFCPDLYNKDILFNYVKNIIKKENLWHSDGEIKKLIKKLQETNMLVLDESHRILLLESNRRSCILYISGEDIDDVDQFFLVNTFKVLAMR